jgi:hypothetical protein
MAKKKTTKAEELKEVSRKEINGIIIITYEDGSVKIIPAPIVLSKEEAEEIFANDEEEEEEEEDSDEDDSDDDSDNEEEEDDEDSDEDDDDDTDEEDEDEDEDDDDSDNEEEEEEEITPESLAEMDFEELEDVCDDKDLDTDPDDYDEDDIEKLRKAVAKELGITLPKADKKAKGKGKKK